MIKKYLSLNLGSGGQSSKDFVSVDITPPADIIADLSLDWPWLTSTIMHIRAYDVLEHLPNKIHTMNEAHRILVANGTIEIQVPITDGRGAFQDPTHISYWTPNDWRYYCDGTIERERFGKSYGIKARFRILNMTNIPSKDEIHHSKVILQAIK